MQRDASNRVGARVPMRVGLVGNPSDGYGGAVVAAPVHALAATVTVAPRASGLRIEGEGVGVEEWSSPADFAADIETHGHPSEQRIVTAALHTLARFRQRPLPPLDLRWRTTIPRSVGLAGSSAIAVAVIGAVATMEGDHLEPSLVAALALEAETTELGIAAGWQDRIVQAYRHNVLIDASSMMTLARRSVPTVCALPQLDVEAVIGWRTSDAEDSGDYHGDLRERTDRGELDASMSELAALAHRAAHAVTVGDRAELERLVRASWAFRCAAMPLRPAHAELVEAVRDVGAAATSPGSGGSVIALPATSEQRTRAVDTLRSMGADVLVVRLP